MANLQVKVGLVASSLLQFVSTLTAFALPEFFVGRITRLDAERFLRSVTQSPENFNASVSVHIGLFESYIEGGYDGRLREGLAPLLCCALASLVAAAISLICAVQDIWKCVEEVQEIEEKHSLDIAMRRCCSKHLHVMLHANILSALSGAAVVAMAAFTAGAVQGVGLGASFVLQLVALSLCCLTHVIKCATEWNKDKITRAGSPPVIRQSIGRRQAVSSA